MVRSWQSEWMRRPSKLGDTLATLIGAEPDEVLIADQTSLNLYKLASSALGAGGSRSTIVTDTGNFPSDIYVLSGVAEQADKAPRDGIPDD